jgi:hypothetical protein
MKKHDFQSTLFDRKILNDDPDFESYAIAEAMYRLDELKERKSLTVHEQETVNRLTKSIAILKKELHHNRKRDQH